MAALDGGSPRPSTIRREALECDTGVCPRWIPHLGRTISLCRKLFLLFHWQLQNKRIVHPSVVVKTKIARNPTKSPLAAQEGSPCCCPGLWAAVSDALVKLSNVLRAVTSLVSLCSLLQPKKWFKNFPCWILNTLTPLQIVVEMFLFPFACLILIFLILWHIQGVENVIN